MTREYNIVDADQHVIFDADYYKRRWPKSLQERAPKAITDPAGGNSWLWEDGYLEPLGLNASAGLPYDKYKRIGLTWDDIRPGCYDPGQRLRDMDEDGIDAAVLFSSDRSVGPLLQYEREPQLAAVQAYNDYMLEEWQSADPERIVGLVQMPNVGVEEALKELNRVKGKGARGIMPRTWPSGNPKISPEDDAFWAACQEMDMPIANHGGNLQGKVRKPLTGPDRSPFDAGPVEGVGSSGSGGSAPSFLAQMILTGVLDRFPRLRIGLIETQACWIPGVLEGLDDRYWRNRHWLGLQLAHPPSEYWKRNFFVTFMVDRFGVQSCRQILGTNTMQWSSDYPHHGTDWPYSRKVIENVFSGVPPEEKQMMIGSNAARVYGLA